MGRVSGGVWGPELEGRAIYGTVYGYRIGRVWERVSAGKPVTICLLEQLCTACTVVTLGTVMRILCRARVIKQETRYCE